MTDTQRVRSPDGVAHEVRFGRALRPRFFLNTPWRTWSLLTRDKSWWVTVESSAVGWPVLREKYIDETDARRRVTSLVEGIENGTDQLSGWPIPWRRVRR
jgi:hypothetical protein